MTHGLATSLISQAMTQPQRLPNAPIVEALLDINASLPDPVGQDKLASFQNRLGKRYPTKEIRQAWTGQVEFKAGLPPEAKGSQSLAGYLFRSADGKQVVQVRKDGFSFSRLKPYEEWDPFSAEARDIWTQFEAFYKPSKVNRIALRFINRIELPMPVADFKDYLLTVPEIAPTLPQNLSTFFFRVVIPDEDLKATAIITETIEEPNSPEGNLPLILDIDVIRQGVFPVNPAKLWPMFDQLRDFKDKIFFSSLTEKALELFK